MTPADLLLVFLTILLSLVWSEEASARSESLARFLFSLISRTSLRWLSLVIFSLFCASKIASGEEFGFDIRFLTRVFCLESLLLDFLMFLGTFSDLGICCLDSDTILFEIEAASLNRKFVDWRRTDSESLEDDDYQQLLISGSSFDVIS